MVRPFNQEDGDSDGSDDEESIICTHLASLSNPSEAVNPQPPQNDQEPSTSRSRETQANTNAEGATTTVLTTAAVATGSAVGGATVATAGLTAAGFTSSGIAAGSMAAASQAAIGNVAAGSMFATFQSIGATGGFAVLGPVGLVAGAIGAGIYLGYRFSRPNSSNNNPDEDEVPDEQSEDGQKPMDDENKDEAKKSDETHFVRGVNICDDCWLRMQIREYKKYEKRNKQNKSERPAQF